MSAERTSGIVLRTFAYRETSLIVRWLTPDWGRIATLAQGAHRPKSPFKGKLDLFFLADLAFRRSRSSDLHTLREVVLRETHLALRQDWHRLRQAAYAALLLEQSTEAETPVAALFGLFREFLAVLAARPWHPALVLAFEARLLAESGLNPSAGSHALAAGARPLLTQLEGLEWGRVGGLPADGRELGAVNAYLQHCLGAALGRVPRGRREALEKPPDGG
jgi:DNA repair protein RecO (recombination protein O)